MFLAIFFQFSSMATLVVASIYKIHTRNALIHAYNHPHMATKCICVHTYFQGI